MTTRARGLKKVLELLSSRAWRLQHRAPLLLGLVSKDATKRGAAERRRKQFARLPAGRPPRTRLAAQIVLNLVDRGRDALQARGLRPTNEAALTEAGRELLEAIVGRPLGAYEKRDLRLDAAKIAKHLDEYRGTLRKT